MSIDELSVLEPSTVPWPAADTVSGPPEDWLAAVTGRTSSAEQEPSLAPEEWSDADGRYAR